MDLAWYWFREDVGVTIAKRKSLLRKSHKTTKPPVICDRPRRSRDTIHNDPSSSPSTEALSIQFVVL
jgi:hypothetical protein